MLDHQSPNHALILMSHLLPTVCWATRRVMASAAVIVLCAGCVSPAPRTPAKPMPTATAPKVARPASKPPAAAASVPAQPPAAAANALPTPALSMAALRPSSFPLVVFPSARPTPPPPTGKVGTQAAGFTLLTPEGQTVAFPEMAAGQPSVLMFWPSWCPYSRALQPYLQSIWQDYQGIGVKLWTININETGDPVAALKSRQLTLPLLLNGDRVADQFGVRLTATVKIVDGSNKVIYSSDDSMPPPAELALEIRRRLNDLLGSKAPALPLAPAIAAQPPAGLPPPPIPESEWVPWVDRYLSTLKPGEWLPEHPLRGEVATGKQAIALARELWSVRYGAEETIRQAPYRSYRINNYWVVLASGAAGAVSVLGQGYVAVIEVGNGRVIRLARQAP